MTAPFIVTNRNFDEKLVYFFFLIPDLGSLEALFTIDPDEIVNTIILFFEQSYNEWTLVIRGAS